MTVTLSPNSRASIRSAVRGDEAMLTQFFGHERLQFACFAPGHLRNGFNAGEEWLAGATLAVSEEGEVLGLSLVEPSDGREGRLIVLLPPGQRSAELVPELIAHAAFAARRLGIERLHTGVLPQRASVLSAFELAGLRPLSSMALGGLTEVVLGVR